MKILSFITSLVPERRPDEAAEVRKELRFLQGADSKQYCRPSEKTPRHRAMRIHFGPSGFYAVGALALALGACAGSSSTPPVTYGMSAYPRGAVASVRGVNTQANLPAPAPISPGVSSGGYASADMPASPSSRVMHENEDGVGSPGAVDVPAEARPGLATEWGETRRSVMSFAPFVRASVSPADVATIHYNDARLATMQALAHSARSVRWAGAYRDGIRVSLRDEYGASLPGYHTGDTVYVLGTSGQRYTILIENDTPARFEAVVSVDGLDVINGRPAATSSRGYVLPPHGHIEIEGFRQSHDTVASFRFGSVGDSYAAQTGDARNVGVIGVAVFAERGAVLDLERNEVELRQRANPFPGGFALPPARQNYN